MTWTVEHIPELAGYTVEWAGPDNYYLSRRNRIYHSTDLKPPFHEIGRVDAPLWRRVASSFRPAQRLLRFMVYNLVPLANGDVFITFDKTVGVLKDGKYRGIEGLHRPCRVLRSGCAVDGRGNVYFGEYLANNERGEIRIYRYPEDGERLESVHTFPPSKIKHIHGVYYDKFTDSIFCLTGDAEDECRILCTRDGFKTIDVIGSGDESWRAVSLLFGKDHFYYGTDAEFRNNRILRVDRETLKRETLGEVSGTVFYSKRVGPDLFFTTTAENAPSQTENVAAIWHVDSAGLVNKLIEFAKDSWHPRLFMFGTIHFPYQNLLDDRLYFSLVAVEGDHQTYCVRRV